MKTIVSFLFPTLKAVIAVCGFFIGIGWGAYAAIQMMVKAEANVIREEVKTYRSIDMDHLDRRFNRIEQLIKEGK